MPADQDSAFYEFLDSIADTGEEDAVQQNKRIKEAQFAEDSREPNAEEEEVIKKDVQESRVEPRSQVSSFRDVVNVAGKLTCSQKQRDIQGNAA